MVVQQKKRKFNAKADSNDIQTAVEDFGQKYHCDSCSKDITHLLIIRCAECADFDLCVSCFQSGTELKDHKKTHSYRVIDVLDFPIFEANWGADEEILLVEGLEMFGLGNWETIADHIGSKNHVQVANHYEKVYVKSEAWPYPNMDDRFDMTPGKRKRARPSGYTVPTLPKPTRPPASQPVNHEIGGFMPGRKEFEHEYENDADQIIKDIEFVDEDTKEDTALKCAVLSNYNLVLDRRLERKAFLYDRNLLDFKKIQGMDKKKAREEREIYAKYSVFAKMQTQADFDSFMEGMVAESKLRTRIAQLQEYVRMGVTSLREANEYEKQKTARANKSINLPALDRGPVKRSIREDSPSLGNGAGGPTKPPPLDISTAPGIELLAVSEQQVCAALRIYPRAYTSLKDVALKEQARMGCVSRKEWKGIVKIEAGRAGKLLEYFQQQGWIELSL